MRSLLVRLTTGTLLLSVLTLAPPAANRACAAVPTAAVVVKSEQKEESFCVDASGGEVTGIDALRKTKLDVKTKSNPQFGEQVCKIEATGTDDCSQGYWAYFQGKDGAWVSSAVGASSTKVSPGNVEGWVWVADANDPNPPQAPTKRPDYNVLCAASLTPAVGRTSEKSNAWLPWAIAGGVVVIVIAVVLVLRSRGSPTP
jgi:hypothetical protein